jgi:hypothetical protein
MHNLFAYTRDPANRIVRFAVDQAVQNAMTAYLNQQIEDFDSDCDEVEFDGKYKPDDGEMLVINEFEDLDNLAHPIGAPLDIPVADPSNFSFDSIRALFFGKTEADGSVSVYLQNFDRRRVISDTGFSIFHAQGVYKKIEGTGLTLDTKVAAKLNGSKLHFFSFFHVRQIFDMTSYYQEATDADIREFAGLDQVTVANLDGLIAVSDSWVRRKLWLIRESRILERVQPNDIKAIAAEFNIPVEYQEVNGEERIKMPEEKKALKTLLRFLDEDYYKSPLSKTNFVTNSKRAL